MQAVARGLAAPAFALAMFTSAALIFALQPMFSRLTTPLLGGSPSVWNTSMVFFQAALLAGYLYAHLLQRVRDMRLQTLIHAGVLAASFVALLPAVQVTTLLGPPNSSFPIPWLLGVLTVSIGAPFAAASATAPLLQAWYSRTGRADAHDPYYLYAASNLGSFLGLLLYPIWVEPTFGAAEQSAYWTWGFAAAALAIIGCGALAVTAHGPRDPNPVMAPTGAAASAESGAARPTWRNRLFWMGAAAAPSGLLLGVTQHLSTDVASAPFLWVAPLALYLVTFIVAFMRGSEKIAPAVLVIHPLTLVLMAVTFMANDWAPALLAHLICFFLSALICHLALARTRPDAQHLTEFYLFVSLGGVLGGALTALVAPVIFNGVYEYPLALAAVALLRPREPIRDKLLDQGVALALGLCTIALMAPLFAPNLFPDASTLQGVDQQSIAVTIALVLAVMVVSLIGVFPALVGKFATMCAAAGGAMVVVMGALLVRDAVGTALAAGAIGAALALLGAALPRSPSQTLIHRAAFLICAVVFAGLSAWISLASDAFITRTIVDGRLDLTVAPTIRLVVMGAALLMLGFVIHAALQKEQAPQPYANIALGASLPLIFTSMVFMALEQRFSNEVIFLIGLGVMALALFLNRNRPYLMAGLIVGLFVMLYLEDEQGSRVIRQDRSFFGVLRVQEAPITDTAGLRILMHGTTIHGAQVTHSAAETRPLTYYNPETALGQSTLHGLGMKENSRVALIGLGTGTTACLLRPTDELVIFEIDPLVVRYSGPQGHTFTYVQRCAPSARVELGDARLQLAEEPDGHYDVIVVDAFSSDAIPAHLLTQEAVAMYMRKLSPTGTLVLHLSNRNLDLVGESARVAHALGVPYVWRVSDYVRDPIAGRFGGLPASAMALTHPENEAWLRAMEGGWTQIPAPPGRPWTDDYINLPRALWANLTGGSADE
ncbi:MAG: hypothetical protein GC206_08045 [Alphaproteobacteria bacterium]|nr:hypothetical protein [Alphaproteobacteria bacterium]